MDDKINKALALAEMVSSYAQENNLSVVLACHEKDKLDDPRVAFVIVNMTGLNSELFCKTIIGQTDVFQKIMQTYLKGLLGENAFNTNYEKIQSIFTKKQ